MAIFFNYFVTIFVILSSYLNIYIGINYYLLIISFFSIILFIIINYKNVKLNFIFLIITALVLWLISLFTPLYDDEFGYVTGLVKQYCLNEKVSASENIGFFSYLYNGYESSVANFYCIDNLYLLRIFNIIIIIAIIAIFLDNFKNKKQAFILLALPVLVTNGLILKNDILAAYLILSLYYFIEKNKKINASLSFSVLTTLKPIFIIDASLILLIYFLYNKEKVLYLVKHILIFTAVSLFPWVHLNYNQFGQPFFPYLNLPFFSLSFFYFDYNSFSDYKILISEQFYSLNNFSILAGNILIYFKNILFKFGLIYIIIWIYACKNFKCDVTNKIIVLLPILILFLSLWEPRYHIGIALIALLSFEKYFRTVSVIKLTLIFQLIFCSFLLFRMYISKSLYFNINGQEVFKIKYLKINDNFKIINFLNNNLDSNDGIIIDNSLFYYLNTNKYYWLNTTSLNKLNNTSYLNYINFINEKNIKYLVIYHDALKGYERFGYSMNKIPATTKFYNDINNILLSLEMNGVIKKITILERNIIYEVIR
jgi:hypothetical protein